VSPVRPHVTALCFSSWDGCVGAVGSLSTPSPALVQGVVRILAGVDAVLESALPEGVGLMNAAWLDEPMRASRLAQGQSARPLSVLVGGNGSVEPRWLKGEASAPRAVYATKLGSADASKPFASLVAERRGAGDPIRPEEVLRSLAEEFGVSRLVVVGGGDLFRRLLEAGCVDELCLVLEPQIFGNNGGGTLTGKPGDYLTASVKASLLRTQELEGECFTWWKLRYGREFAEKVDALKSMA
jgi:riboflavin biosynthesis pyrimidine reductase